MELLVQAGSSKTHDLMTVESGCFESKVVLVTRLQSRLGRLAHSGVTFANSGVDSSHAQD